MSGPEETRAAFSMAHLFYIPFCLLVGGVVGWLFGGRAARGELSRLRRQLAESEAAAAQKRVAGLEGSADQGGLK